MPNDTAKYIHLKKEIVVNSPLHIPWTLVAAPQNWHYWRKYLKWTNNTSPVAAGLKFQFKTFFVHNCQIVSISRNKNILWSEKTQGNTAQFYFEFNAVDSSTTTIMLEFKSSGWLSRVLKLIYPRYHDRFLIKTLTRLKEQSEKRKLNDFSDTIQMR